MPEAKKGDLKRIKRGIREDKSRLNTQAVAQDTLNREQKRDQGKKNVYSLSKVGQNGQGS